MAYYYQDPSHDVYAYEYGNNGNHSNKYNEYEPYSDHAKPDHCEYEDTPEGYGYGHGESEYGGDEAQELRELRHKDGVAYGDRYELKREGEFESMMLEYKATEEPAYGGHSVQISDGYVDNMMTLYRLRRPSGRPPDDT